MGISARRGRNGRINKNLVESPVGHRTREEKTVGQGRVGEPLGEGTTLRQTHQGAIRKTDGISPGPRGEPTSVVPHRQAVGHHQEEIRHLRTPSTTRVTPEVREVTSRI